MEPFIRLRVLHSLLTIIIICTGSYGHVWCIRRSFQNFIELFWICPGLPCTLNVSARRISHETGAMDFIYRYNMVMVGRAAYIPQERL